MVNPDPKYGRWVLPLIIVAMVVLTYTFVNSISPTDNPTGTTQVDASSTTVPSSTTTLSPEVAAFMVTLDIFESQAQTYSEDMDRINSQWDTRGATFAETRTALVDLQDEISSWENQVAQVEGVPDPLAAGHVDLVIQVSNLAPKVADVIAGLEAPDDGTLRRAAVAEFQVDIDQVLAAIDAIRATANGTDTSTTTTTAVGTTETTTADTTSTTTTTTAGG